MDKDLMRRLVYASAVTVGGCALHGASASRHLPAGDLLETENRAAPPQDVTLRAVYSKGLQVTKDSEGWRSRLYDDAARYCTIGYGHLVKRARCDGSEPPKFLSGLTKPAGELLLLDDMSGAQFTVMSSVRVAMTDGQFGALVDFVFNVGSTNFRNSTLLRTVNSSQLNRVSGQFRRWTKAGGQVWPGLEKRREREIDLFFEGIENLRAVPPEGEDLSPIDIRNGE